MSPETVGNATGGSENSGDFVFRLVHHACHDPPADQAAVLPAALARALASSATASLLSHPDVAEGFAAGRADGGKEDRRADVVEENDGDAYSRLVAEAYCSFLVVAGSGDGDRRFRENQANKKGGVDDERSAPTPPRSEVQPSQSSSSCPQSTSRFVQLQTDERLHFLRSFTELIEGTAEEITCGMGVSGYRCDDAVRRMTNGLWEVARSQLMPVAEEYADGEEDDEFR